MGALVSLSTTPFNASTLIVSDVAPSCRVGSTREFPLMFVLARWVLKPGDLNSTRAGPDGTLVN